MTRSTRSWSGRPALCGAAGRATDALRDGAPPTEAAALLTESLDGAGLVLVCDNVERVEAIVGFRPVRGQRDVNTATTEVRDRCNPGSELEIGVRAMSHMSAGFRQQALVVIVDPYAMGEHRSISERL